MNFIGKLAANRGTILFVGTKRAARDISRQEAERCGMPYVNNRWLGGMLTNHKTVKRSIQRMKEIQASESDGTMERLTKKEQIGQRRELAKLERSLSGIADMPGLPDAMFVVDVGYEKIAVSEARKLGIPVIGVVDTNNSPDKIDYVIPGNDDAIRAIQLYLGSVADAIVEGRGSLSELISEGDEFVELDANGELIVGDTGATAKVKVKSKAKAKAAPAEKADKPAVAEADAAEPAAEAAAAKKTVAKKKVTTKKAETKKADSKKADSKKAATRKTATKKTAAKKTTTKKTTRKTAAKADSEASSDDS